jgi:hypothetical protein
MARRSQLLVRNGHRIGSNQHRVEVLSNVYLDQQQASTRSLLHFRFAINNGHTQARSEYPKGARNGPTATAEFGATDLNC